MWLVTFLLLISNTHADNSAFQGALSQTGLQNVTQWLTDWLQHELGSIKIPDVRGGIDILLGTVYYILHDMSIVRCDLPAPSVTFSEGTGISIEISGLSLAIIGHWNTKFGAIHDGGTFDLVVYSINLNTVLELGSDNGHLSISTVLCEADVGGVNAKFHGGGSFFFQPFVELFTGQFANKISTTICPSLGHGVEALEKQLATMSVALHIDSYVYMNISLTSSPSITEQEFRLDFKGEVYNIDYPTEPPFSPNHFKLPTYENYMMSLGVSEFSLNSAAYAYYKAGIFKKVFTEDMIPKSSPLHLNTSQFGFLVPQLPKFYPNMLMEVLLYANETPLLFFNKTTINIHLITAAKVFVVRTDSEKIPIFKLDIEFSFSAKANIEQQILKGMLQLTNLTVTLGSTEIGVFSTDPINKMMKLMMTTFILPKVNHRLKEGLPLPTVKGFRLQNSVMTIYNGFFVIATDVVSPYDKQ